MTKKTSFLDPGEKEIENAVLTFLNYQIGVLAFKVNTVGIWDSRIGAYRKPSRFIINGTPDVLVCLSFKGLPYFVGMEIKSASGKQSKEQLAFQERLQDRADGFYFVIRSVAEAEKALNLVRATIEKKMSGGQDEESLHAGRDRPMGSRGTSD